MDFEDYSCASPWERFVKAIEAELRRWTKPSFDRNQRSPVCATVVHTAQGQRATRSGTDYHYYLYYHFAPDAARPSEPKRRVVQEDDKGGPLANWFTVSDYIVLTRHPALEIKSSESDFMLSSLCVAANYCSCNLPLFAGTAEVRSRTFCGQRLHATAPKRYDVRICKEVPASLSYLEGLLHLFRARTRRTVKSAKRCTVSVVKRYRNDFGMQDQALYGAQYEWRKANELINWGPPLDPLSLVMLEAIWPPQHEGHYGHNAVFSSFEDPHTATFWNLSVMWRPNSAWHQEAQRNTPLSAAAAALCAYLVALQPVNACSRSPSPSSPSSASSSSASPQDDSIGTDGDVLKSSESQHNNDANDQHQHNQTNEKAASDSEHDSEDEHQDNANRNDEAVEEDHLSDKHRASPQLNLDASASIPHDYLEQLLDGVFIDGDNCEENADGDDSDDDDDDSHSRGDGSERDIEAGVASAPPNSILFRLAFAVCRMHADGHLSLAGISNVWLGFVQRLRQRCSAAAGGSRRCAVPFLSRCSVPDFRFSLLHQKLQMLNYTTGIMHRTEAVRTRAQWQQLRSKSSTSPDWCRWEDCWPVNEEQLSGANGGERGDKRQSDAERSTEQRIREPQLQSWPVLTYDSYVIKRALLKRLRDEKNVQADGVHWRLTTDPLRCLMASWKHANPGLSLEVFAQWYASTGTPGSVQCGSVMRAVWSEAKALEATLQPPLIQPEVEMEQILNDLRHIDQHRLLWELSRLAVCSAVQLLRQTEGFTAGVTRLHELAGGVFSQIGCLPVPLPLSVSFHHKAHGHTAAVEQLRLLERDCARTASLLQCAQPDPALISKIISEESKWVAVHTRAAAESLLTDSATLRGCLYSTDFRLTDRDGNLLLSSQKKEEFRLSTAFCPRWALPIVNGDT